MRSDRAKLAILVVSYCNPEDVGRCLKSLALSDWKDFEVFICENGGGDAFERLLKAIAGPDRPLQQIQGGSDILDKPAGRLVTVAKCQFRSRTNVVRLGLATDNLGYGGGVNAWLEHLRGSSGWDAVLVLNPDTEVDEHCLSELMAKAAEGFDMVGGTLVFDDKPDKVVNYGLRWSRMTGRVVAVGRNSPAGSAPSTETLANIDAISGACVLVTHAFVEDVGLMAEDYFLYMEDLDWGHRRGRHRIGFASNAVIRHIGGTTIGSAVDPKKRSRLSIYLTSRNSILYSRRFAGARWVCHFAVGLVFAARYFLTRSSASAKIAFLGLLDGAKGKTGRPDIPLG
jgi:N-acetylglucosaminyl-diphospho-decaprenol L-rhamnosyltransferase